MDISSLKKNVAVIQGGEWVSDIPNMGDLRLRVRGMTSPLVRELRNRKERAAVKSERNRDGSLTSSAGLRITCEVLFEAVLLDWDGLTDDGKPMPYDAETARIYLTDPAFESFADAVVWAANVVDNISAEKKEVSAKNSAKPSRGT